MARNLTLEDVLEDVVDQKAFEAPAEVSQGGARRIKSGTYKAHVARTYLRQQDGGVNEGRKFLSMQMKLYLDDDEFQGIAFAKASWSLVTKKDGTPDMQFRLFQQLLQALGPVPVETPLVDILEAVEGEWLEVWGKETYNVANADLLPAHQKDAQPGSKTTMVFLDEGPSGDAVATAYIGKGYKPDFMVMSIRKIKEHTE